MAALTSTRVSTTPRGAVPAMACPLAAGSKAIEGGIACLDSASPGFIYPAVAGSATLEPVGWFTQTVDNTAGSTTVPVGVKFNREKWLSFWDSVGGGGAVTAASFGATVYLASDHEVTVTSTDNSAAGRVWLVRADGQVGVEFPF